jgi:DNA-binding IclR family transcriptional regulator
LRALAEAAGETATLHVRSGNRGVLVLGVESTGQVLRRAATVGETTWLGQGSSGLAILAHLAAADADPVIAQAEDPAGLRETLAEVRRDGYKMSFGANHPGVHGIAAPVPSAGMSVAVSGPAERWTEERMRAFSERLLNACAELSVLFDDSSALPRGY